MFWHEHVKNPAKTIAHSMYTAQACPYLKFKIMSAWHMAAACYVKNKKEHQLT